jgi:hypothetical protein
MKKNRLKSKDKKGSALALTMFILAGMLMSALGGSYVILLGIKAAGIQSQSTKAYYAAESGAERLLYGMRKNGYVSETISTSTPVFEALLTGPSYKVYYIYFPPFIFSSIGEFNNTKRSVQIRIGD